MSTLCRRISGLIRQLRVPTFATLEQPKNAFSAPSKLLPSASMYSTKSAPPTINEKLMEFFDEPKNWEEENIKVGRSWKKEELRIKSNEDLHKLWFVLLKEKNMLLTMEHECKRDYQVFVNPERIDKVEESMENLETVVRERNRAYFELETGETGERAGKLVHNAIGMRYFYKHTEHLIPKFMNKKWRSEIVHGYQGRAVKLFLRRYKEKMVGRQTWVMHCKRKRVSRLLRFMPHIKEETLRVAFPDVDIEAAKNHKDARGNHDNFS